jgi:hypothetical protein
MDVMILRRSLLTIYGIFCGGLWAAVVNRAVVDNSLSAAIVAVFFAASVGGVGWWLAGKPEWPSKPLLMFLPLIPFMVMLAMAGMGLIVLALLVMWPYAAIQHIRMERKYRTMLRSKGRFITLDELQPHLGAGTGTLILESVEKGAYRIWWTEDDLHSLGEPVSTKDDFIAVINGQHPFNTQCQKEYLDEETGKAFLTSIPARHARSGKLSQMFPRMKTAIVYRRFMQPKKDVAGSDK